MECVGPEAEHDIEWPFSSNIQNVKFRFLVREVDQGSISRLQMRHSPNIFARICGEKVGHRRTAKLDRAISMNISLSSMFKKSTLDSAVGESKNQPSGTIYYKTGLQKKIRQF